MLRPPDPACGGVAKEGEGAADARRFSPSTKSSTGYLCQSQTFYRLPGHALASPAGASPDIASARAPGCPALGPASLVEPLAHSAQAALGPPGMAPADSSEAVVLRVPPWGDPFGPVLLTITWRRRLQPHCLDPPGRRSPQGSAVLGRGVLAGDARLWDGDRMGSTPGAVRSIRR
jgi:hypothetical protein